MTDSALYNLALQLTQHLKALWRIEKHYRTDAANCAKCQELWDTIERDMQRHADALKTELKNHLAAE